MEQRSGIDKIGWSKNNINFSKAELMSSRYRGRSGIHLYTLINLQNSILSAPLILDFTPSDIYRSAEVLKLIFCEHSMR